VEEDSWLPTEPLDLLGHAPPIMIEELNESEVGELVEAAPRLAELMRDGHPARNVVRNLFRLAHIAGRPASEPTATTGLDMAEQWWKTADGRSDASLDTGRRERARTLRAIADRTLAGAYLINVQEQAGAAIEELVRSETLFDRGNDVVTFRHDVLREWAI